MGERPKFECRIGARIEAPMRVGGVWREEGVRRAGAGSFHSSVPCYFCRIIGVEVLSVQIFLHISFQFPVLSPDT